jgi:hypothetical protein
MILVVLITMAIVLYLMFGMNTGGSSGGGSTSKNGGGSTYMGQVAKTRKQGRETANMITTQQLSTLIAQYRVDHNGKLPKSAADFEESASSFNDQWGNPMTFTFEESKGKTTVTYHSNGPDGEPNTEDDVPRKDTIPF